MAKSWIKLTKAGPIFGLAHFTGDVIEVGDDKYKEIVAAGGCVPAEAAEIEEAKVAMAERERKSAAATLAAGPSNADLLSKIAELQAQFAKK